MNGHGVWNITCFGVEGYGQEQLSQQSPVHSFFCVIFGLGYGIVFSVSAFSLLYKLMTFPCILAMIVVLVLRQMVKAR